MIGFELFKVLRSEFECIEVYPQAIVRELGLGKHYKTTSEGHSEQVAALARRMNASVDGLHRQLFEIGYGSRHDKLDALMSAWVASLDEENRVALGNPPEDVIWVPRT